MGSIMDLSGRRKNHDQAELEKALFLLGLIIYAGGQSMIAFGRGFIDSLSPIDFAHWALMVGAIFLIPYSISANRGILSRLSSYALLIGVAGIVGMCVIDFVIWSYPPGPERRAFLEHISAEPSVWLPFIYIGPWLFGIGLVLVSLRFYATARFGVLIVVIGSIVSAPTTSWFTVLAYVLIAVGYVVCFRRPEKPS